ncbi:MAG: hypothetical protein FJW27_00420 [Acidimicrobiia bacterium]|nr:hypothetical protein [Acidimicrobiia bacterium]
MQSFRRRLEQAVHDAEERSRAQDADRVRLEREVADASALAAAAAGERDAKHELTRVTRELDSLRSQLGADAARTSSLEQDLENRDRLIESLRQAQQAEMRTAAEAAACKPFSAPTPGVQAIPTQSPVSDDLGHAVGIEAPEPRAASATPTPPSTAPEDAATPLMATTSPCEETVQQARPEALEWPHSLHAPARAGAAADIDGVVASTEGLADAPVDDRPVSPSPDSTGVFSSVADALRAWTIETVAPGEGALSSDPSAVSPVSSAHGDIADRPRTEVPQYDVVRKSARHDLASRRIEVTLDQEPGHLVDLSAKGAQVITSSMLKPGRQVRLAFPTAGPLATAKAKIVWSRLEPPTHGGGELQYRAGLTFLKIDPKTIDRVLAAPHSSQASTKRSR